MALELTVRSSHTNWEEPLRIHGLGFGEHGPLTLETPRIGIMFCALGCPRLSALVFVIPICLDF